MAHDEAPTGMAAHRADEALKLVPGWFDEPLRGLVFWLGYHSVRYRHYPLTEGAIVAELTAFLHARIPAISTAICPETLYREIARGDFGSTRADIVVGPVQKVNNRVRPKPELVEAIIEVKRSNYWPAIDTDLRRLLAYLATAQAAQARAFLVVACQAGPPPECFATKSDSVGWKASRRGIPLHDAQGQLVGKARARRIVRAAASITKEASSTHHVCLVEVVRVTEEGVNA